MQSPHPDFINPDPQSRIHWPSVWQFGLSLFSILALWGISLVMLGTVLNSAYLGDTLGALSVLLNAAGAAFAGLLLIPSTGYAFLRLLNRPTAFYFHFRHPGWIILALPPVILLGQWVATADVAAFFFLPVMHVLAAAISVAWLLALGKRGLAVGSPQLTWGVFNAGLVGAPFLSLITELFALILVGFFALLYLLQDPQLLDLFLKLSKTITTDVSEATLDMLESYIMRPSTLYFGLFYGALIVPLLEELFKPIGVWLLVRGKPTPAQGFAAGLLSGAGYALFENFLLGGGAGEEWAVVIIARMSTSLIHILTAGLMGWALAQAWSGRRYLQLGVTYLVAVSIHGLWNGLVILTVVSDLFGSDVEIPEIFEAVKVASPVIYAIIILACFFLLVGFNTVLRRAIPRGDIIPQEGDIIPPAQPQMILETSPEKELINNGNYHKSD